MAVRDAIGKQANKRALAVKDAIGKQGEWLRLANTEHSSTSNKERNWETTRRECMGSHVLGRARLMSQAEENLVLASSRQIPPVPVAFLSRSSSCLPSFCQFPPFLSLRASFRQFSPLSAPDVFPVRPVPPSSSQFLPVLASSCQFPDPFLVVPRSRNTGLYF